MPLLAKFWPRVPTKTLVKEKKILSNTHKTAVSLFPGISLKIISFVPITHSSPHRIQYYFHARNSKMMLGFSVQVRICCQSSHGQAITLISYFKIPDIILWRARWILVILSVNVYHKYQLFRLQSMCRCCTEQPSQKSTQLPPVTHFSSSSVTS